MTLSTQQLVNRIAEWCEDNKVPLSEVHVIGSAAMFLHGIVVDVDELDIQLPYPESFTDLEPSYINVTKSEGKQYGYWFFDEGKMCVHEAVEKESQQYGAFAISTLAQLRKDCEEVGRPKDLQKITLIDAHLSTV